MKYFLLLEYKSQMTHLIEDGYCRLLTFAILEVFMISADWTTLI